MKSIFNAVSSVKGFLGKYLTVAGWLVLPFLAITAEAAKSASLVVDPTGLTAAALGAFEGSVAFFEGPVFTTDYTEAVPTLLLQIWNSMKSGAELVGEAATGDFSTITDGIESGGEAIVEHLTLW